LVEGKRIK